MYLSVYIYICIHYICVCMCHVYTHTFCKYCQVSLHSSYSRLYSHLLGHLSISFSTYPHPAWLFLNTFIIFANFSFNRENIHISCSFKDNNI